MEQTPFNAAEFAENPEPRVACVLILDVSSSMDGAPIQLLNEGVNTLKNDLSSDSLARKRVELAVVTFGNEANVVSDFTTVDAFAPPVLSAGGMTPTGQAVALAMDLVESRKSEYKANGIAYYRPWLFLLTDGEPNDEGWETVAARSAQSDKDKKFALFGVFIDVSLNEASRGTALANLQKFSAREPVKLKGLNFNQMFLWLSSSMKSVSRSTPSEQVPLANPYAAGWASV